MRKDIAIIGLAGRFPGAADIEAFYRVLRDGRDCVAPPSRKRIAESTFPLTNEAYQAMGALDEIDKFDHRFFNISFGEARAMDPHQRLIMEVAHEILESSGYSTGHFSGTRTSVVTPNAYYEYHDHMPGEDTFMFSGNTAFSAAGRISRFFNLRAPAFMVDTGCSSSLMALNLVIDQLILGNIEMAMVVGSHVFMEPAHLTDHFDVGVTSPDGKTHTFNADSNGSGCAETVAGVLLKPLEQALADDDIIYAVIKGAAANSSAQTAGSLTATSSVAQAEIIREAWRKAEIDPETVTYIEAHGSGTKLGDPIEIAGIDLAFREFTQRKQFCAVSCVKTNIGHTDMLSGMAGLVKAVLSLYHRQLFPSLHFETPNPLIDFDHSATYVNTSLKAWETPDGCPRRAGVSTFGFAGNNVHVLLEEPPSRGGRHDQGQAVHDRAFLICLSAKRRSGVRDQLIQLAKYMETQPLAGIDDISCTLNLGRDHHRCRIALVACDREDLGRRLHALASAKSLSVVEPLETQSLLFLFSDSPQITPELVAAYRGQPLFTETYDQCRAYRPAAEQDARFRDFAFRYALFKLLEAHGLTTENVLGVGSGDIVVRCISEEITPEEALAEALAYHAGEIENLSDRLCAMVTRETEDERVIFVEVGPRGNLPSALENLDVEDKDGLYAVCALSGVDGDGIPHLFRDLYLEGYPIDWAAYYRRHPGRKMRLPGYPFERIRCWYREPYSDAELDAWIARLADPGGEGALDDGGNAGEAASAAAIEPPSAQIQVESGWREIERALGQIWREVLGLKTLGLDDDFFALGGHSLFGTMVANRIEKQFKIKLDIRDIFTFNTLRSLAQGVTMLLQDGNAAGSRGITPAAVAENYPLTHNQMRLWVLANMGDAQNLAYNLPSVLRIRGPLDHERLTRTFNRIIERHENFRSSYHEMGGVPRQRVHEHAALCIPVTCAQASELDDLIDGLIKPFDLAAAPLIRLHLIELGEQDHVLFFDMHHIIFDGASTHVLLHEFRELYAGRALSPMPLQYKDYAVWQRNFLAGEGGAHQEAYWLARFAERPPVLNLPTDFPRPENRSYRGDAQLFPLGAERTGQLSALARENGATLFMVLLAGYMILLSKYSGQDDIVVGTPIAGRPDADLENLMGMFVNTLAMRGFPHEARTFDGFLSEIKQTCLNAYRNQDYPIESLIEALKIPRDPARNALFDTMLVLQNLNLDESNALEDLDIQEYPYHDQAAKFDLTFEFLEQAGDLTLRLEYSTDLFREAGIKKLAEDLFAIYDAAVANPKQKLKEIDLCQNLKTAAPSEAEAFDFSEL